MTAISTSPLGFEGRKNFFSCGKILFFLLLFKFTDKKNASI